MFSAKCKFVCLWQCDSGPFTPWFYEWINIRSGTLNILLSRVSSKLWYSWKTRDGIDFDLIPNCCWSFIRSLLGDIKKIDPNYRKSTAFAFCESTILKHECCRNCWLHGSSCTCLATTLVVKGYNVCPAINLQNFQITSEKKRNNNYYLHVFKISKYWITPCCVKVWCPIWLIFTPVYFWRAGWWRWPTFEMFNHHGSIEAWPCCCYCWTDYNKLKCKVVMISPVCSRPNISVLRAIIIILSVNIKYPLQ